MSLAAKPTPDELTATFDAILAGSPDDPIASDTGLDQATLAAVDRARGGTSAALVEAARQELAMQLDGTHILEADAIGMRAFDNQQEAP